MSRPFPIRTKALIALMHCWAVTGLLGAILTMSVTTKAQSPNPSDAIAGTPTPVAPGPGRGDIEFGPIREVGPRIRRALENDDDLSEFMHLVEDPLGVLSDENASELADDAHRLTAHGIPAMFIIRESSRSREQSVIDAERLRLENALETTPGADDGLLFLVTRPEGRGGTRGSRQSMFLTISPGANTLPKGGLNEASLQEVQDRFIRPRLRFGLLADGLRVGIRKIIYLETYYPDPLPPLTSLQSTAQSTLGVIAPLVSVASLGSVVAAWRNRTRRFRSRRSANRTRYVSALALAGFAISLLAVCSVYSQSRAGIVAVIISILVIAAHIRLLRHGADASPLPVRVIHAPSHRMRTKKTGQTRTRVAPGSKRSAISGTSAQ